MTRNKAHVSTIMQYRSYARTRNHYVLPGNKNDLVHRVIAADRIKMVCRESVRNLKEGGVVGGSTEERRRCYPVGGVKEEGGQTVPRQSLHLPRAPRSHIRRSTLLTPCSQPRSCLSICSLFPSIFQGLNSPTDQHLGQRIRTNLQININ